MRDRATEIREGLRDEALRRGRIEFNPSDRSVRGRLVSIEYWIFTEATPHLPFNSVEI